MHTSSTKTFHTTTTRETVLPVTYIDTYKDPKIKELMHQYKFGSPSHKAQQTLFRLLIDLCIAHLSIDKAVTVFTCPPSTMYARGEKAEDSMWSLLEHAKTDLYFYTQPSLRTHVLYAKVFAIGNSFLKNRRAQHIDSDRRSRTADIHKRYRVSLLWRIWFYYLINIRDIKSFSFCIIDDVASTGGTLLACKETLSVYLQKIQKKKPEISFDIQAFSLTH